MSFVQAHSQQAMPLSSCSTSTFLIPKIPGIEVNQLNANLVQNCSSSYGRGHYIGHEAWSVDSLEFCNVSIAYNHVGHHDPIHVQVWLPAKESWNGRLMGVGGGGWGAGLWDFSFWTMACGTSEGYVTVSTDAGHNPVTENIVSWALTGSGEVNMYPLQNFAHTAQGDAAQIAKLVTEDFYGTKPKYSYWNGCSTGGRQGLSLAQRYPDAYDGVFAMAPAINWAQMVSSLYWPQLVMNQLGEYPHPCEFEALTAAAIEHCDCDDGVQDGVISDPAACTFEPQEMLGRTVDCASSSIPIKISSTAINVAKEAWSGPKTVHGQFLWYGVRPGARLTGPPSLADTNCDDSHGCHGAPFGISAEWLSVFIAKDPNLNLTSLTYMGYERLFNESSAKHNAIIGTNDPDLSAFRDTGGKMITIHGLADALIPPQGTQQYYDSVLARDPSAPTYYKYFEAPGIEHCFGGAGPFPGHAFDDLVAWVEKGIEPKILMASSSPNQNGEVFERPLCQYPLVARYTGTGDPKKAQNYYCAESYLSATPIGNVLQKVRKALQRYASGR